MTYYKTIISGLSLVLLNGCLEVEDNSNDQLVEALNAQTQALENQQQSINTVSFQGIVVNAFDGKTLTNATINVIVGSEVIVENLIITNGVFEISDLPANSDIELIISSANDQFLSRAFFLNTGASGEGEAFKDFGTFPVSEGQEIKLSILDSTDNSAVESLVFTGTSHVGSSSSEIKYQHTSIFDSTTGEYSIFLPKDIYTPITASLDVDSDGILDYTPELSSYLSGSYLVINSVNSFESTSLYLTQEVEPEMTTVEYRVSVVGTDASILSNAQVVIDSGEVSFPLTYDSTTEQYTGFAPFDDFLSVNVGAFTENDTSYQSSSLYLYEQSSGSLSVNSSNSSGNCCYTLPNSDVVDLIISPNINSSFSSSLELITESEEISAVDDSYSAFYSQPVSIDESNVSLTHTSGYTVIKGNDSTDDLILPGITSIVGDLDIPVSHVMSLNNTRVTVTPDSRLLNPGSYEYNIDTVEVIQFSEGVDISGDSFSFTITNSEDDVFDINDVKLDNENYTTQGNVITASNTAGETSSSSDSNGSVYLYFPNSLNSLQNFTMRKVVVTNDSVANNDINILNIVDNGSISYSYNSTVGLLKLAENETAVEDDLSLDIIYGTAQPDTQYIFRVSSSEYMSDDTPTSTNTISFEYAYETKLGEISTGTITLPVQ